MVVVRNHCSCCLFAMWRSFAHETLLLKRKGVVDAWADLLCNWGYGCVIPLPQQQGNSAQRLLQERVLEMRWYSWWSCVLLQQKRPPMPWRRAVPPLVGE